MHVFFCWEIRPSASTSPVSLLTDWLELLDPEIVNTHLDLQEQLVFGSKSVASVTGKERLAKKKKGSPYLLALLTHQSQWSTIQRCLHTILSRDKLMRYGFFCHLHCYKCRTGTRPFLALSVR